jgi:predicted DNA-binding protein (MmcQ/YjbR family)
MNLDAVRNYCLSLPHVTEDTPFDEDTLAFRVGNKIFGLTSINDFEYINLKCDPERAVELRDQYDGIKPGFHMNKKHWNSVYPGLGIKPDLLKELIKHSYDLIYKSLPKKIREELGSL